MAKWADFLVSAKRMSNDNSKISLLKVHKDSNENYGPPFEETRSVVISNIERGNHYMTMFKNPSTGKMDKGATINVILTPSGKFLRTDKNQTSKDNLENLPDF